MFVTLLSCLFLKEACGLFEIFNLALVIGGIVLVVQPPFIFGTGEVNIKSKLDISSTVFYGLLEPSQVIGG